MVENSFAELISFNMYVPAHKKLENNKDPRQDKSETRHVTDHVEKYAVHTSS